MTDFLKDQSLIITDRVRLATSQEVIRDMRFLEQSYTL